MPAIERLTDINTENDPIVTCLQSSVFANNLLVGVNGSILASKAKTANGSNNVFINGMPVNRIGDIDTSGFARKTGSMNVFVNMDVSKPQNELSNGLLQWLVDLVDEMTPRNFFAGSALRGLLKTSTSTPDEIATRAYEISDAMLAAQ